MNNNNLNDDIENYSIPYSGNKDPESEPESEPEPEPTVIMEPELRPTELLEELRDSVGDDEQALDTFFNDDDPPPTSMFRRH